MLKSRVEKLDLGDKVYVRVAYTGLLIEGVVVAIFGELIDGEWVASHYQVDVNGEIEVHYPENLIKRKE